MLAKNIRLLRLKKGLSQEKLARLADISNATLIKIEVGVAKEPTITTVAKIATALEVSIDELVRKKMNKKNRERICPK
jgi:transcriptional regulator with XRE-family HTH domain